MNLTIRTLSALLTCGLLTFPMMSGCASKDQSRIEKSAQAQRDAVDRSAEAQKEAISRAEKAQIDAVKRNNALDAAAENRSPSAGQQPDTAPSAADHGQPRSDEEARRAKDIRR